MGQQGKYTEAEFIDLSEFYQEFDCDDSTNWLSSTLDSLKVKTTENNTRERHKVKNNNNIFGVQVSTEESRIKSELEMEIERDLEEEIKESIYHLALKLHRIYQQRKERKTKEASEGNKALSEVNISIRMEGRTKIEIKEVNKEVSEKGHPPNTSRQENVKGVNVFSGNKFDWVKTLRGGSRPVFVKRSNDSLKKKDRILNIDPNVFSNSKFDCARGKNASVDNKQLQLGWKV